MPKVNPEILRWARETAGFDLVEAAARIDLHAAHGSEGADRLAAMESGSAEPSRALLTRMAKQYRRPLLAFYLSAPPRKGNRGHDFRTLPEGSNSADEALLDTLVRDVFARQALVRSALEDEGDDARLAWVGSARVESQPDKLSTVIRSQLGFDLEAFRRTGGPQAAFTLLRGLVERTGVYVMLAGDVGSHHTALDASVFRGLALADPVVPFVVVNDNDSRAAWSFTLLHEFVHLWLGHSGVSGGVPVRRVERFCNDVASKILLPGDELRSWWLSVGADATSLQQAVSTFSSGRNLSRTMVAYRVYRLGAITLDEFHVFADDVKRDWRQSQESQPKPTGGPSYYVVRRHRLGGALLRTTKRLLEAGSLTTMKASRILGVKPANLPVLLRTEIRSR